MPCVVSCRRSEARCSALFVASVGYALGERCLRGFARFCNVVAVWTAWDDGSVVLAVLSHALAVLSQALC